MAEPAAGPAIRVTVRYFAAARAAAGTECETIGIAPGSTVADLVDLLAGRDAGLARVLSRCSFLCDSIAVRDLGTALDSGRTIDVLPPFAGG